MSWDDIGKRLREPFPPEAIEWRVAQAGEKDHGKPWAKVLAYLTNRAIMERLDSTVGCGAWWNEYRTGPQGGVICGLTILHEGLAVTKWDGADNTDIENVKGGLSDSMKRSAVQWGIGRYLYDLEEGWALTSPKVERGWRYQPAKQGKYSSFYWSPPELPQWALPEGMKAKTTRKQAEMPDGGEPAPAKPAPAKPNNPYGIPADAWAILDAAKTYDEMYQACTSLRGHSRGDNATGENWNAALNTFFKDRKDFFKDIESSGFVSDGRPE